MATRRTSLNPLGEAANGCAGLGHRGFPECPLIRNRFAFRDLMRD